MRIGIPKEIKPLEHRISLIPAAVRELTEAGLEVWVEQAAGESSGYTDEAYLSAGASIAQTAEQLFKQTDLIIKVKEPIGADLALLEERHLLFSYLHLAALPTLTQQLQQIGLTAIGFETVEVAGALPLLAPMSDIAGRLSVHIGTQLLHKPQGGKGLLLGGLPGVDRGNVVILGAGVAGGNAALVAAGLGANVTVFDRNRAKLGQMRNLGSNVSGLQSYHERIAEAVAEADLLIGAVLITGQKAPHLVSEQEVAAMQPGSVIIDIAVDQGGCIETTRPTDYTQPTFLSHDVVHFGVTNMPGAVPRSASQALSAAILPWVLKLAKSDWQKDRALSAAINVSSGKIVHQALL